MWIYKGSIFDREIKDLFGFVYLITLPDGRKYIGKKNFFTLRRKRSFKKRVRSESNWREYYSSSEDLKALIDTYESKEGIQREILELAISQGHLNYLESKYLFQNNVLESPEYLNQNIMGRYFSKNVEKYSQVI